jgi:hypothetical protein
MYIKLDALLRDQVSLLRRHGFDPCVVSSMSGLAWTQKHFSMEDWTLRDFEDSAVGEAMSNEILPILAVYQMHCTLADLGVPVLHKFVNDQSEVLSQISSLELSDAVILTDPENNIWLKTDASVIHYSSLMNGSDFIPIFSSQHILATFGLTRSQFLEMVLLVSCLPLPQFHKRCMKLAKASMDKLISDVNLLDLVSLIKWSKETLGSSMIASSNMAISNHIERSRELLISDPIANIKDWLRVCGYSDVLIDCENVASDSLPSGSDDPSSAADARDQESAATIPSCSSPTEVLRGYGADLPKFNGLFPKLGKSLRDLLPKSRAKADSVPTLALNYLR